MKHIWARGEATVREVLEALNRGPKTRAYTTVMTTMRRLDSQKGLLARERRGRTDVYSPTIGEEAYAEARVAAEVGDLMEAFGDVALAHFARQVGRLDPARAREVRRLARDG